MNFTTHSLDFSSNSLITLSVTSSGCLDQQGLGKLIDIVTKHYFRSTSHQNEKALALMQKQNRLEMLTDKNVKLPKHHEIVCSNCKQSGHNKLTYTKACTVCVGLLCLVLILLTCQMAPECCSASKKIFLEDSVYVSFLL